MKSQIYFQDLNRTSNLEEFLKGQIEQLIEQFIPDRNFNLFTRIHTVRARSKNKQSLFLCEIRLDAPRFTSPIVIKKKDTNIGAGILHVSTVLRKVLRRESVLRNEKIKRNYIKFIHQHQEMPNTDAIAS